MNFEISGRDFVQPIDFLFLFYFQIYEWKEIINWASPQRFQSALLFFLILEYYLLNRDLHRACLIYMFSLRFSGNKFLKQHAILPPENYNIMSMKRNHSDM